jgi:hypothetical protein
MRFVRPRCIGGKCSWEHFVQRRELFYDCAEHDGPSSCWDCRVSCCVQMYVVNDSSRYSVNHGKRSFGTELCFSDNVHVWISRHRHRWNYNCPYSHYRLTLPSAVIQFRNAVAIVFVCMNTKRWMYGVKNPSPPMHRRTCRSRDQSYLAKAPRLPHRLRCAALNTLIPIPNLRF